MLYTKKSGWLCPFARAMVVTWLFDKPIIDLL